MGAVIGKVGVDVPAHRIVRKTDDYQIWRYPSQVAAVVYARDLPPGPDGKVLRDDKFTSKAFPTLARYIGVFGAAENRSASAGAAEADGEGAAKEDGSEKVAMTAPVVMTAAAPEKIAMTAPVVMTRAGTEAEAAGQTEKVAMTAPVVMSPAREEGAQCMKFLLPAKYSSVEEAPVPTNDAVKIETVAGGRCHAVVQFSGNFEMGRMEEFARKLLEALERDGVTVTGDWEAMGYNPPFTLPWLKRNEVHVPIDPAPYEGEEGTLHTEVQ